MAFAKGSLRRTSRSEPGVDRFDPGTTAAGESQPSGPAFVELTSPAMVGKQCRFELDNGSGATMRVQLVGYDAADIEALSRSFWSAL
jgi:hypothetical protein